MLSKERTPPSQGGIRGEETGSRGCEHSSIREESPWAEAWERERNHLKATGRQPVGIRGQWLR